MEKKFFYVITGLVLGNYWGGGSGSYPAKRLEGTNLDELLKEAEEGIETGSLDSGMGFESLEGARLVIETRTTIIFEGKEYTNSESKKRYIGKLSCRHREFLNEVAYES